MVGIQTVPRVQTMAPDEALWQAGAGERGVISATFYARLRKHMVAAGLQPSGVHILRHTSAKVLTTSERDRADV